MVGSLVFLGVGFLASISSTEPLVQYGFAIPPLLIGLALWARNQAYLRRWGPRTRQDGPLLRALRGLDARYHLFVAPGAHLPDYLLLGPMGLLVIVPRPVSGAVTGYHDRWRHDDGRPIIGRLLFWFTVRPTLGNPTAEVDRGVERTQRHLAARLSAEIAEKAPLEGIIVFTHPQVVLTQQGGRVPALLLKSLRSHVRRLPRSLDQQAVERIAATLTSDR